MKMIRNATIASFAALAAIASPAHANTLSLSGPANVTVGDSFQLTIEGDFSSNGLLGGGSTFGFDPALVTVDSISLDIAADPAFSCPSGTNGGCTSTANSESIWWGSFSVLINPGAPVTTMATISLTAVGAGSALFSLADDPGAGGWADAAFGDATPAFSGMSVDVAPIPVPAAVWLFGSGLLGLVGVARRKAEA